MRYQIQQQHIILQHNCLKHGADVISLTDKTEAALTLFLQQPQHVISKDDFMQAVWGDLIVSDASLFKQIQVCRDVLQSIGLPKDVIENVYGRGYRLKYPVVPEPEHDAAEQPPNTSPNRHRVAWFIILFFVVIAALWWFYYPDQITGDNLSEAEKTALVELAKSDWQAAQTHIQELLSDKQVDYSAADLAFLYQQAGQAALELQNYSKAVTALNQSLDYARKSDRDKLAGETRILLSRAYGATGEESLQRQQINQAVDLFKQSEYTAQAVDALMELAFLYKKDGDFDLAIETYRRAEKRAIEGDDSVGQMMAINNLAATYLTMNDVEQAQTLLSQGLALSLDIGEGRYIASAYSMMSQIYLQQEQPLKALGHIQQALGYQLKTNSGRGLNPKLMTFNYLLIKTFRYKQAEALLALTSDYVAKLNQQSPMAIIQMYRGMNQAHQGHWQQAASQLNDAWQAAQVNNFNYRQPTLLAYLAISQANNGAPIQALEAAQRVITHPDAEKSDQNLARVALTEAHYQLENTSQWQQINLDDAFKDEQDNLFAAQQWWQFRLRVTAKSALNYSRFQQELTGINAQMQSIKDRAQVDDSLLQSLQKYMTQFIEQRNNAAQSDSTT